MGIDRNALTAAYGNDASPWGVGEVIALADVHAELRRFVQDGLCHGMFGWRFRDRSRFEQGCAAHVARGTISVTAGVPNVRVPVLSSRLVSTSASFSRYNPRLTIAPSCAARPMEPRIARGVPAAMPHAPATMSPILGSHMDLRCENT
jgi:hypothetical protein